MVCIACAAISNETSTSSTINLNGVVWSVLFMTTVTIWPSGFWNDVLSSVLRLTVVLTRFAPGSMNFEKWPM